MSETLRPESQFKNILETINSYPLWLKESLAIYLKENLTMNKSAFTLNYTSVSDCLFLYEPRLNRTGQMILENAESQPDEVDKRLVAFLKCVQKNKNIVDIAQDNGWTLKMCCYYILKAWEKNIILPTYSKHVYALIRYIVNDIEIGELLVRIGRISKEQYDWVTKINKTGMMMSFEEEQKPEKSEDVFVNLGYVTAEELKSLEELFKIANQQELVVDKASSLIIKTNEAQAKALKIEQAAKALFEEKQELERKVQKLANEVELQKSEKIQYSQEIAFLKGELKKALKAEK